MTALPAPPVLPPELRGVWRRLSLALAETAPAEEQAVTWLQGASAFADLRVPLVAGGATTATAFAGTTTYQPPDLTWHRAVDLDNASHADTGAVTWHDGDLVERGTFPFLGVGVAYVEVWRRVVTGGPVLALEAPGARLVRIGDHAITVVDRRPVGGFAACYRTLGPAGWDVAGGLGCAYHLLPCPPVGEAWEAGDEVVLPRSGSGAPASWTVVEAGVHEQAAPAARAAT